MNLQQANFENLLASYYQGTTAHEAAKYLGNLIRRGNQEEQIAKLLRDYRQRAIPSQKEINRRAATDRLMKCCSVLEIASLSGFIPDIKQTEFGHDIRPILENKHVRLYYENFYPEKLPQLFRCRLEGTNNVSIKIDSNDINRTIMVFLDIDRRFMEKLDDSYLLRMLDSFTIDGYRFKHVIELIGNPDKFINNLMVVPKNRDVMSQTLNEFSIFMQFCFDLQQLLIQTSSYPLIQSAMWNHYSYWFGKIGSQMRKQLGDALLKFLEWEPVGDGGNEIKAIQDYVSAAQSVLKNLISSDYASPINALLEANFLKKNIEIDEKVDERLLGL